MIGFGLLCGHLIGDYVLQNDWMAKWKTNPEPKEEDYSVEYLQSARGVSRPFLIVNDKRRQNTANLACTVHCALYTFAIWLFSFWWMPLWGLAVVFLAHWPIDRFRLAYRWMQHSGQRHFSSKEHPMFPWSIVVVDNTFHLVPLFVIGVVHFDLIF